MSLAEWSNTFGLFALCRESNYQNEISLGLSNVDSFHAIIYGNKNTMHISQKEIIYLFENGICENTNLDNTDIRSYSLFEKSELTEKLLRPMLTPRLSMYDSKDEIGCIFLRFHKSKLNVFKNFVEYIGESACIWSVIKFDNCSYLDVNYLNSKGAILRQFTSNKIFQFKNFKKMRVTKIYQMLKENQKWYFMHIRPNKLYKKEKLMQIYDFKKYVIWKWISFWLPLSINEDMSNVFDMNKYLIETISNKLKVRLNAIDVIERLGIHVCQLIPITLLKIFTHELNLSSPIFTAYRKIRNNSFDMWEFNHTELNNICNVYAKLQENIYYYKGHKYWFMEYLLNALKLPNAEFQKYMENNNLMMAYNEQEKKKKTQKFIIEEKWNNYKLKTIYKLIMLGSHIY
jgi:hypothetical protein